METLGNDLAIRLRHHSDGMVVALIQGVATRPVFLKRAVHVQLLTTSAGEYTGMAWEGRKIYSRDLIQSYWDYWVRSLD